MSTKLRRGFGTLTPDRLSLLPQDGKGPTPTHPHSLVGESLFWDVKIEDPETDAVGVLHLEASNTAFPQFGDNGDTPHEPEIKHGSDAVSRFVVPQIQT